MRFDKLELDPSPDGPNRGPAKLREDRDSAYWAKAADEQRRSGAYETALRFYSRALELEKTLVPAWVGQVQMLVQLNENPQATLWSRKALELFPNQPDLLAGQAQAECRQGNLKEALALSDGAIRQKGESAYRWQVRGELMVAGKERNDRHCFDKANIANGDWLVPLESALIYYRYGGYANGVRYAQQAVEKAPDSPFAWFTLGNLQRKLAFDDAACRSYQRCIELRPNYTEAHVRLNELSQPTLPMGRLLRRFFRDK